MRNRKEYDKQYYIDNKERITQYWQNHREHKKEYDKQYEFNNRKERKQYRADNKEKIAKKNRKYYLENREQIKKVMRRYFQSKSYKLFQRKRNFKRRNLGFYALNKYFRGLEAHHISQNFVIYMPKELHQSIPHNIWTGKNMEQINKLAIEFL